MENVVAPIAIIGFVNGLRLFQSDKAGFVYFLIGVAGGLVAGYLNWFGLVGLEQGFLAGLASSGFYRAVQVVGKEKKEYQ